MILCNIIGMDKQNLYLQRSRNISVNSPEENFTGDKIYWVY